MKVEIKNSVGKGRGVFTRTKIAKEAVIESCPVILFKVPSGEHHLLEGYSFRWSKKQVALLTGCGSLYNHSDDPNAILCPDKSTHTVDVVALRPIKKGEEVCIDYTGGLGYKLWFKIR